jgi:hypothetical protein
MTPIVLSFYTIGTPYEQEVVNLITSCKKLGIETDIVGISSKGSWEKNCAVKPFFILQKLQAWNRPVLWVDADAVFKQFPNFSIFEGIDFSVRVNEFLPKTHESRVVSNTIFIQNNTKGKSILEEWCQNTEKALHDQERVLEFWDQTALRDAIYAQEDIRFLPMPLAYAKIFDFDALFISEAEVIIEHYQASRRFKSSVHVSKDHCCH